MLSMTLLIVRSGSLYEDYSVYVLNMTTHSCLFYITSGLNAFSFPVNVMDPAPLYPFEYYCLGINPFSCLLLFDAPNCLKDDLSRFLNDHLEFVYFWCHMNLFAFKLTSWV